MGVTQTDWGRQFVQIVVNAAFYIAAIGITGMIYLADGVSSNYYQGLSLVIIAMFTVNSYRAKQNLIVGLIIIAIYFLTVMIHPVPISPERLALPLFFMSSNLAFVVIMTKLYAEQHYKEFLKSSQLASIAVKLHESNRRLKDTEKLKDRFVANVSHELRTPLTLILGPVKRRLEDRDLSNDMRADLNTIRRNAAFLLKQVNDLLDISKLDAGKMSLTLKKVDICKLVRFVASYFEVVASDRNIRLELDLPDSLYVKVDIEKIERTIMNILSNAFKFSPEGGTVFVKVHHQLDKLHINIQDNGPGIPEDKVSVIFDRFRQVESDDTRSHGGTGLGLAIAKEFIEQHGGSIQARNVAQGGALFLISVPGVVLNERDDTQEYLPENSDLDMRAMSGSFIDVQKDPTDSHSGSNPSVQKNQGEDLPLILVVEDNVEMHRFIGSAFERIARVLSATDGLAALEVLKQNAVDLIVTDLMMPRLSGDQLIQRIRSNESYLDIPIIVLTAKADEPLRDFLLRNGAQDFLAKPFSEEELRARASNLLVMKAVRDMLQSEVSEKHHNLVKLAEELKRSKGTTEVALGKAEAALRSRDEFLMNLSHELRTPLTAVLGWADLILSGDLEPDQLKTAMTTIEKNAKAQLRLINDLLDVSRIVQGKLQLEVHANDLREIVKLAVKSAEVSARTKGIQLNLTLPKTPVVVLFDWDRLHQVIWNLISNALKFTPGEGRIEVVLSSQGSTAEVSVSDNGEGLAKDVQPFVFERLRQGDSSTTKKHGGLGLGLAIARHIVEMHGGTIGVESAGKGCGSRFFFRLPTYLSGNHNSKEAVSSHVEL